MVSKRILALCQNCGQELSSKTARHCRTCLYVVANPTISGESHYRCKLTEAQAIEIKTLRLSGESTPNLVKMYGVSQGVIQALVAGRTWKNIHVDAKPPALPTGDSEYATIHEWPEYAVGKDGTVWRRWYGHWKRRKASPDKDGYLCVQLKETNRRTRQCKVHRLVLEAFVGPCPEGMECCHWNGIKSDNNLTNIRWDTILENREDGRRLKEIPIGSQVYASKLKEDDVVAIRTRVASGERMCVIASEYGVSHSNISTIASRKTWKHV